MSKSRQLRAYARWLDWLLTLLMYFGVVFAPWALGTVPPATITIMNVAGYSIAAVLALNWGVKRSLRTKESDSEDTKRRSLGAVLGMDVTLKVLFVLVIGYAGVHWLNARAVLDPDTLTLEYNPDYWSFLPHSYDRILTGDMIMRTLALAFWFWGTVVWLGNGSK